MGLLLERLEERNAPGKLFGGLGEADTLFGLVNSRDPGRLIPWPHPQTELVIRYARTDYGWHPVVGQFITDLEMRVQRNALETDGSNTNVWAYGLRYGQQQTYGETAYNVGPLGTPVFTQVAPSAPSDQKYRTASQNGGADWVELNEPSGFDAYFLPGSHAAGCWWNNAADELTVFHSVQWLNGYPKLYGFGDPRYSLKVQVSVPLQGYIEDMTGSTIYAAEAAHYLTVFDTTAESNLYQNPAAVRIRWLATPLSGATTAEQEWETEIPCYETQPGGGGE